MASRTLANLMYVRGGAEGPRMEVLKKGFTKLQGMTIGRAEDRTRLTIQYRGRTGLPTVMANNLRLGTNKFHPSIAGRKVYYEARLKTSGGLRLGWSSGRATFDAELGVGLGQNSWSFALDGSSGTLLYGGNESQFGPSSGWAWSEGDVLGFMLDLDEGKMWVSVNGSLLQPEPAFTMATHGGPDVWKYGFAPAGSFPPGQGAVFNLSGDPETEPFAFLPPGYVSVLVAKKGPRPSHPLQLLHWTKVDWHVFAATPGKASAFRPVDLSGDKLQQSLEDVLGAQERLQANHRRQLARALGGLEDGGKGAVEMDLVGLAVELSACDDVDTSRWALRMLLRSVQRDRQVLQRVMGSQVFMRAVVRASTGGGRTHKGVSYEGVLRALCSDTSVFLETARQHLAPDKDEAPPDKADKDQLYVFESEHPYLPSRTEVLEVCIPNAECLKIFFDRKFALADSSLVTFFLDDPRTCPTPRMLGDGPYDSSFQHAFWPNHEHPLFVRACRVFVKFESGEVTDWGWRFAAVGVTEAEIPDNLRALASLRHAVVLESPHPYPNNSHEPATEVFIPSASTLQVLFDSECRTEANWDCVKLYAEDPRVNPCAKLYGLEKYQGGHKGSEKNWASTRPVYIPSNRVWVYFESDSSTFSWGWRLVVVPGDSVVGSVDEGFQALLQQDECQVIEGQHPYVADQEVRHVLDGKGARAVSLAFDSCTAMCQGDSLRLCRLEADEDHTTVDLYGRTIRTYVGSADGSVKGEDGSALPSAAHPLVAAATRLVLVHSSQAGNSHWGYRLACLPLRDFVDPIERLAEEHGKKCLVLESPHEYKGGEVQWFDIDLPDAVALSVTFHSLTGVRSQDVLSFHPSRESDELIGQSWFGGHKCQRSFPGLDGLPALQVPAGKCVVKFDTTQLGECSEPVWGWKLVAVGLPDRLREWGGDKGMLFETEHEYQASQDTMFEVSLPEGVMEAEIAFDERSVGPPSLHQAYAQQITFRRAYTASFVLAS